jgi:hypothetical protein
MMPQHAALPLDSVVPREREPSAWTGWVIFAGSMMIVLGVFNAVLSAHGADLAQPGG